MESEGCGLYFGNLSPHVTFRCFSGFMSTDDSNAPGNYALLDQVAALHWLKENIGKFSFLCICQFQFDSEPP